VEPLDDVLDDVLVEPLDVLLTEEPVVEDEVGLAVVEVVVVPVVYIVVDVADILNKSITG